VLFYMFLERGLAMAKRFELWLAGMTGLSWCVLFIAYGVAAFVAGRLL
jgi:hypothetical protein